MTVYHRRCNNCGKYYEGQGDKFCSRKCGYIYKKEHTKFPNINYDVLHHLYWGEQLSRREMAQKLKITDSQVYRLMKKYNVPRRTLSESARIAIKMGRSTFMQMALRRGEESPTWKGGRSKTPSGYIIVHNPNHPNSSTRGYIYEHRLIWEQCHNTLLPSDITIHHLNGIRDDNRPENLVAVPRPQHETHTLLKLAQQKILDLERQLNDFQINR